MIYIDVPPKSPTCSYVVKCTRTEYEAFIESLFKDAPEDAEYYLTGNHKTYPCWIKNVNGSVCNYIVLVSTDYNEHKNDTWESFKSDGVLKIGELIPRPHKKIKDLGDVADTNVGEWNGEGLPPVGVECEIAGQTEFFKHDKPEGHKVKIYTKFTDDRGVELFVFVDKCGNVGGVGVAKLFRPLKTEVEKERERLATELFFDATDSDMSIEDAKTTAMFNDCLRAIDRGWRK